MPTEILVNTQILNAFKAQNTRVPVWFMRQAGRYLREYQELKKNYSLDELFKTPELAAEITCQPIDILNVDAAILFADILTLPGDMGFKIRFDKFKGPVIQENDIFKDIHDFENLSHVTKTIQMVKKKLSGKVPLIGFAGGPFTVLTYLIEGGSSESYKKTYAFLEENESKYHQIMEILTKNTIDYLKLQRNAGIDLYQIFDSWAGLLTRAQYKKYIFPYVQMIFEQVQLPSIYFTRNTKVLLNNLNELNVDFISVDETVTLAKETKELKNKGIQGNLFNELLNGPDEAIQEEVTRILKAAKESHSKYIFNLNHGVLPQTDVQKLKLIVQCVHNFQWKI